MPRIDIRHHDDRGERTIAKRERYSKMTDPVEYALEVVARAEDRLADERKELEAGISTAWQRVEQVKATTAEAQAQAEQAKMEAENAKRRWQMAIGVAEREVGQEGNDTPKASDDTLKGGDDSDDTPVDTSDTSKPTTTPKRGLTASESIAQRRLASDRAQLLASDRAQSRLTPAKSSSDVEGQWVHCKITKGKGVGRSNWIYLSAAQWLAMPQPERARYVFQRNDREGNYYPLRSRPSSRRIPGTRVTRSPRMRW
jgi:hypothetical protein